jgi:hypothetical protein
MVEMSMTEISNKLDCDKSTYHRYTETYDFFLTNTEKKIFRY